MLGQSLQSFASQIKNKDVARPNRFVAMIMPPGGSDNSVNLMCESAEFPGQNIRTTPDTLRYGPQREIGHAAMYAQSMTLTFICLSGMPERTYFENWQSRVFDPDTWEANYYSDYIGTIALHQLDKNDGQKWSMYVKEAYPKTVAAQTFSQGNNSSYQTLSVNFTFRNYETGGAGSGGPPSLGGLGGGLGGLAGKLGGLAGGLSGVMSGLPGLPSSLGGIVGQLSSASSIVGAAAGLGKNLVSTANAVNNIRSKLGPLLG